jgi:hypothetical protein
MDGLLELANQQLDLPGKFTLQGVSNALADQNEI